MSSGTRGPTFDVRSYGAVCDGSHDDTAALDQAIGAAGSAGGGTVILPPGRCTVVATAGHRYLTLGTGISVQGAGSGRTTLALRSDDAGDYRELFHVTGSDVSVSGLTMVRAGAVYGVFVSWQPGRGLTMKDVVMDGRRQQYGGSVLHGIMVGSQGTMRDLTLDHVTIENLDYGFLESDTATAHVSGVTVSHSTFRDNAADDLNFNAPAGAMSAVSVTDSSFSGGRSYALAFANVDGVTVDGNTISGYAKEFVHLENRTRNVAITGNAFSGNGTAPYDWYSFIFVVSGSHDIAIRGNTFTASAAGSPFQCIYVGPGGSPLVPTGITISGNQTSLGSNTKLLASYGGAQVSGAS